jgi:hypothetical protein
MRSILLIGLSCLVLAVMLSIAPALKPEWQVQTLIATLSDGFMMCLAALLALLSGDALRRRR